MNKVLALSTSPRRNGNSESALDLFLSKIGGSFSVEKIRLNDIDASPCRGCGFCERAGECVQKDAVLPLIDKMLESDVLVFASPVYALSVCAQAKVLIDRCQMLWARKYVLKTAPKMPEKRGVFIATAGQESAAVFDHMVPVARFLFDVAGVRERNMQYILLPGLDKKGEFSVSEMSQKAVLDAAAVFLAER